jgi:hypothetical protein
MNSASFTATSELEQVIKCLLKKAQKVEEAWRRPGGGLEDARITNLKC